MLHKYQGNMGIYKRCGSVLKVLTSYSKHKDGEAIKSKTRSVLDAKKLFVCLRNPFTHLGSSEESTSMFNEIANNLEVKQLKNLNWAGTRMETFLKSFRKCITYVVTLISIIIARRQATPR